MPTLSPSSYVVLGLLQCYGPATPYALDTRIRGSIGHFWGFPRSQLYAEAARLTRRGLVEETREDHGRRRRVLAVTPTGRAELARWLRTPIDQPTEIRDEGLLRLFFLRPPTAGDAGAELQPTVRRLAAEQEAAHRARLAEYERLVASGDLTEGSALRATVEFGLQFERLAVAYWAGIGEDPPAG